MTSETLKILILLSVFGAVLLAVEATLSYFRSSRHSAKAINKRLQLISAGMSRDQVVSSLLRRPSGTPDWLPWPFSGILERLEKSLSGSGLRLPASQAVSYLCLAAIAIFIVAVVLLYGGGYLLTPGKLFLLVCAALAIGFGIPMLVLSRMANKRRKRLVEQFPVALDVFVRGLRAGHPVASALDLLTTEMADPIGSEFGLVVDEVTYGADLRDALQDMATRCGIDDMHMFVTSLAVQSETGGNLAEVLEKLGLVIRDRASVLMKVRALSSEGRMTGTLLTALPIGVFSFLFITNPAFYLEVADDPAFITGFSVLLIAFGIGVMWIRKLVDLKV